MRKWLVLLGSLALIAVVVIGLTSVSGGDSSTDPPDSLEDAREQLAGAPAPLAALHAQASTLVGGGKPAFEERMAALKGHPIVINKWASWCAPCQAEFGIFEAVGTERGKEVAFLGVNGTDKDKAARNFLAKRWLPVPSYTDPDEDIAQAIEAPKNYPITVFVDKNGKTVRVHSGVYKSKDQLNEDIDKYFGL